MIDTQQIKQSSDLTTLAAAVTTLASEGRNEYSGPCPKCGGQDRFHVNAQGFFCRQCKYGGDAHPWFDAIEFNRWMYGDSFKQACNRLSGGETFSPVKRSISRAAKREFDTDYYSQRVSTWHDQLFSDSGKLGQDYLYGRALHEGTWATYRFGFSPNIPLPATNNKEKHAAITIPWYVGGKLVGIQYRFLETHGKIKTKKRGNLAGKLWGGCTLPKSDPHWRTLVVSEGELNAASIYQVAGHTNLDVLSIGSQSQTIAAAAEQHFAKYDHVIFWLDEYQATIDKMGELRNATGFSPGKDANELLQSGQLGGVLSALRLKIAKEKDCINLLQNDLQHGANSLLGIDDGTNAILDNIL